MTEAPTQSKVDLLAKHGLIDDRELARQLDVPINWVNQQADAGAIPSIIVGRKRRFNVNSVVTAIATQAADSTPPVLSIRVMKDGNKYCAVFGNFINLQESDAGFGDTPNDSVIDLLNSQVPAKA